MDDELFELDLALNEYWKTRNICNFRFGGVLCRYVYQNFKNWCIDGGQHQ